MPSKRITPHVCRRCGAIFEAVERTAALDQRYCSSDCRWGSLSTKLWRNVDKTGDCWVRNGPNRTSYTLVRRPGGRQQVAHRAAWEEATGETLTDDEVIGHTCDTRPCVRNDNRGIYLVEGVEYPRVGHLFKAIGDLANVRDMIAKGRKRVSSGDNHYSRHHPERVARGARSGWVTKREAFPVGSRHPRAKLTEDMVIEIRRMHANGEGSQTAIGRLFGVTQGAVKRIVRREVWTHI